MGRLGGLDPGRDHQCPSLWCCKPTPPTADTHLLVEPHVHELHDPLLHVWPAAIPDVPLGSAQPREELLSFGRRDGHRGLGGAGAGSCHCLGGGGRTSGKQNKKKILKNPETPSG